MPFIDEVRDIAFDVNKEQIIIKKLTELKNMLREDFACLIYNTIKAQIKKQASEGKITNNLISGVTSVPSSYKITCSDRDLSILPKGSLSKYLAQEYEENSFSFDKLIDASNYIDGVLSLVNMSIEYKTDIIQKQVGIFFKRTKTVKKKNLHCKIYKNETTKLINNVKSKCLSDGIKIEDVFFNVWFNHRNDPNFEPFNDYIRLENPVITIPNDFYTRTCYTYFKRSFYGYRDPKLLEVKNSYIVFKYSFAM
ncbi:MAG: hypothetical protein NC037_00250 [Bacteroides sp.]|nr:hypothetical protein [Bacillota bacterium]MCM1393751.1 hypothetical protein [[Eubacterium] siraeum]MCM1454948.1 hypothetical protein [Bacteroides sp.]